MLKIRHAIIALGMLLSPAGSFAQVSIGIEAPHISIGINLHAYPELVVVPSYPVYYAPGLDENYFFYDGMYWVYEDDNWYASSWYNGPWWFVDPEDVPVFILRVPVRYYRRPPVYFYGWRHDAPPRWGHHWGHGWEQRRSGWDRWNRRAVPAPAPLPVYQRQYSKDRYPRQVEQQQEIQKQKYRYQPRDPIVRQHYKKEQAAPAALPPQGKPRQEKPRTPEVNDSGKRNAPGPEPRLQGRPVAPLPAPVQGEREDVRNPMPVSPPAEPRLQGAPVPPRPQPAQRRGDDIQRSVPVSPQPRRPEVQEHQQPPPPVLERRQPQSPRSQDRDEKQQGEDAPRASKRKPGQEREQKQEQEQEREQDRERDRRDRRGS